MSVDVAPVATIEEITPQWLTQALGRQVTAVKSVRVGAGQMGACYRIELSGDDTLPATVLAKLPTLNEGMREFLHGMYSTEVQFYDELASTVDIQVPECCYAAIGEKGVFTILLEDLVNATQGDQIAGCSITHAQSALATLAGLQGPRWSDSSLFDIEGRSLATAEDGAMLDSTFPDAVELVISNLDGMLSEVDIDTLRELTPYVGAWSCQRQERFVLMHGDYRLDNLMFSDDGKDVWAVDWQSVALANPGRDVAYFLGTCLSIDDRRSHEHELVEGYHSKLMSYSVQGYSLEQAFEDYRFGMLQMPVIVIFGCAYGERTERGDQMFATMIARGCAAIRELETLSLIELP